MAYNETLEGIGNQTSQENLLKGKAVILFPPAPTDLDYVNESKQNPSTQNVRVQKVKI